MAGPAPSGWTASAPAPDAPRTRRIFAGTPRSRPRARGSSWNDRRNRAPAGSPSPHSSTIAPSSPRTHPWASPTRANTRPGGLHASGTRPASTAYPAKNRAFLNVKRVPARISHGAPAVAAGQESGSKASKVRTRPRKVTAASPARTIPATTRSSFHVRAFTERREVVSQTRPPSYTNTTGVRCGPEGVRTARWHRTPW